MDDYTVDGLIIRLIYDKETSQRVNAYFKDEQQFLPAETIMSNIRQ